MKNNGTMALETERLRLRKFAAEDAEQSFQNWTSDTNASMYFANYPHQEKRDTETMIAHWIQSYQDDSTYIWALELKDTGEVVGMISADASYAALEICEIGYILGSSWWNKGYASEALHEVLRYLICQEGFYLVEAKYNSTNRASGKLLHKLGFQQDAILRGRRIDKESGERNDLVVCSILKSEYAEKYC